MGCFGSTGRKTARSAADEPESHRALVDVEGAQVLNARRQAIQELSEKLPHDPQQKDGQRDVQSVLLYLQRYSARREDEGVCPDGADRTAALRWLRYGMRCQSEQKPGFKAVNFWLISNLRMWPDALNPDEKGFADLKAFASGKLDALGETQERDVYEKLRLASQLGALGDDIGQQYRPRQDDDAGLLLPSDYKAGLGDGYVLLLRIAACAIDDLYKARAKAAFAAAGVGANVLPDARQPGVKNYMRMVAKLSTDHREAREPRAAENADTNRVAWVVDAAELPRVFAAAAKEFGEPLRVKNNYSPAFDALTFSKGYRCILANYLYDTGRLWGDLAAEVAAAVDDVKADIANTLSQVGAPEENIARMIDKATQVGRHFSCSTGCAHLPAKLVVEVQFMTPEYYHMRKQTHAWYKVVRADDADSMLVDHMGGLKEVL